MLSKSGKNGMNIDLQGTVEMEKHEFAKSKLPYVLTVQQVFGEIESILGDLRRHIKGVVPTFKG